MNIMSPPANRVAFAPPTSGADAIDGGVGGGLVRSGLHGICSDPTHAAAAVGFALMMAMRATLAKPIVVVRDDRCVAAHGRLYGDGIVDLGGNPADVILVYAADALSTLRAAADAVACPEVGSVILEPWRSSPVFSLNASRRLAFRAERSGVLVLHVRIDTVTVPSAAATRWQVTGSRSTALAAEAPGHPTFEINLLRHRGGIAGFNARVEWNRDQQSFNDAPVPRVVPAVAIGRTCDEGERRAA